MVSNAFSSSVLPSLCTHRTLEFDGLIVLIIHNRKEEDVDCCEDWGSGGWLFMSSILKTPLPSPPPPKKKLLTHEKLAMTEMLRKEKRQMITESTQNDIRTFYISLFALLKVPADVDSLTPQLSCFSAHHA